MRLYKITAQFAECFETIYAGSQAEAAAARKGFSERGVKRKDVESVEVEVPTGKAGLIAFLNGLAA